mmetsp:Transcript_29097/g.78769  ORF Transcript_29097/g.78769 Transcript_29097/m.78769 type:complete len:467 (-) Transcript_29097:2600-4000(-)
MGKRGNDLSQVSKEDYENSLRSSTDPPKGPFSKASADVMKSRRIIRARKSGIKRGTAPTPSTSNSNSIFSGVSLAANSGSATGSGGGGSNPFGGFSFGSTSTTSIPALAPAKPATFPSFAKPAALTSKPLASPGVMALATSEKSSERTELVAEKIKCARAHLKWSRENDTGVYDLVAGERFVATFAKICESDSTAATTKSATSKPLFGAKPAPSAAAPSPAANSFSFKPAVSSAASSAPAAAKFSFGAPKTGAVAAPAASGGFSFDTSKTSESPAPAASGGFGGFSFNTAKTGEAAAPVPAFSFSTTPAPAVKAAAEAAAVETSAKADGTADDEINNEVDGADGVQEAEDNPYSVLFKINVKVFSDKTQKYTARGVLKLEQHKETKKNRLVVRDKAVGRVQLNVAVSKGMPVTKFLNPASKPGKSPTPVVLIKAIVDPSSDSLENLRLITKMEDHEPLFDELSKLV